GGGADGADVEDAGVLAVEAAPLVEECGADAAGGAGGLEAGGGDVEAVVGAVVGVDVEVEVGAVGLGAGVGADAEVEVVGVVGGVNVVDGAGDVVLRVDLEARLGGPLGDVAVDGGRQPLGAGLVVAVREDGEAVHAISLGGEAQADFVFVLEEEGAAVVEVVAVAGIALKEDAVDVGTGGVVVVLEGGVEEKGAAVLEDELGRVGGADALHELAPAGGGPFGLGDGVPGVGRAGVGGVGEDAVAAEDVENLVEAALAVHGLGLGLEDVEPGGVADVDVGAEPLGIAIGFAVELGARAVAGGAVGEMVGVAVDVVGRVAGAAGGGLAGERVAVGVGGRGDGALDEAGGEVVARIEARAGAAGDGLELRDAVGVADDVAAAVALVDAGTVVLAEGDVGEDADVVGGAEDVVQAVLEVGDLRLGDVGWLDNDDPFAVLLDLVEQGGIPGAVVDVVGVLAGETFGRSGEQRVLNERGGGQPEGQQSAIYRWGHGKKRTGLKSKTKAINQNA